LVLIPTERFCPVEPMLLKTRPGWEQRIKLNMKMIKSYPFKATVIKVISVYRVAELRRN